MLSQLFPGPRTGRDCDRAGAERFSAGDVARRVADDVDLVRGKFSAVLFLRPGTGKWSELVPIVVVVGESAKLKKMPDAIVAELQFCAAGDVAGEKGEHQMFSRF